MTKYDGGMENHNNFQTIPDHVVLTMNKTGLVYAYFCFQYHLYTTMTYHGTLNTSIQI